MPRLATVGAFLCLLLLSVLPVPTPDKKPALQREVENRSNRYPVIEGQAKQPCSCGNNHRRG
jgi:hypothetical protein